MLQRDIKENNVIPNIVIVLFSVIETFKYFNFISVMLANALGVLIGAFVITYNLMNNHINKRSTVISFFVVYTIFGLLSHMINENIDLPELLWPIFFMGISLILLDTNLSPVAAKIAFYFFSITSIVLIMKAGGRIFYISTSESRNYCSVYSLCFLSIYIITLAKKGVTKLPLYEVIVNMIVSILSLGRGGIVSSVVLIIITIFNRYDYFIDSIKKYGFKIKLKTFLLFIVITLAIVTFIQSDYFTTMKTYFEYSANFFQKRGLSGQRSKIWRDYVNVVFSTPLSILIAPKITGTSLLDRYSFNLHNSYLMLYARYGFIVFVWVIILLIKIIKKFFKHNHMLLGLTLVIMIRIFTDVISFNGVMDVPLYFLMFVTPQALERFGYIQSNNFAHSRYSNRGKLYE